MREIKNLKRNPFRKILSRRREIITPPDLLSVPKESFENFRSIHKNPLKRDPNKGLESLFRNIFSFRRPKRSIRS
jgi:DNA-directed RNA polymerase subunit beta